MQDVLKCLLVLQEKDSQIAALIKQLRAAPEEKEKLRQGMQQQESANDAAKQAYFDVQSRIKTMETDIERHKTKIGDLVGKSAQVRKNDEYKAMMLEIANHKTKIAELEDQELAEWETRDIAKAAHTEAEKQLQQARARSAEKVREIEQGETAAHAVIAKLKAERAALVPTVPADLLHDYERATASSVLTGAFRKGLVPLNNDYCGGCFLKATASIHQRVKRGDLVRCESCGALLYEGEG